MNILNCVLKVDKKYTKFWALGRVNFELRLKFDNYYKDLLINTFFTVFFEWEAFVCI